MSRAIKRDGVIVKQCPKCGKFWMTENVNESDGFRGQCEECEKKMRWFVKNPKRVWAARTLGGHRQRGFEVEITVDLLFDLALYTEECWICGCELDWSVGTKGKAKPNSPTLDRINNDSVLTLDNVQIICYRCNMAKSTMSMDEFTDYCTAVSERLRECGYGDTKNRHKQLRSEVFGCLNMVAP